MSNMQEILEQLAGGLEEITGAKAFNEAMAVAVDCGIVAIAVTGGVENHEWREGINKENGPAPLLPSDVEAYRLFEASMIETLLTARRGFASRGIAVMPTHPGVSVSYEYLRA